MYICAPPITNVFRSESSEGAELIAESIELTTTAPEADSGDRLRLMTIFVRSLRGRKRGGMLSHVFRPITTALVVCRNISTTVDEEDRGREYTPGFALLVTRAKYAISFLNPFQGSPPPFPIPILLVAATIKVRSPGLMFELFSLNEVCSGFVVGCGIVFPVENSFNPRLCGEIRVADWVVGEQEDDSDIKVGQNATCDLK